MDRAYFFYAQKLIDVLYRMMDKHVKVYLDMCLLYAYHHQQAQRHPQVAILPLHV